VGPGVGEVPLARRLALVPVLLAVAAVAAAPPGARASERTVGCSGTVAAWGRAGCAVEFTLPRFDDRDAVDYGRLVARVTGALATDWRVQAAVTDGQGVTYLAWYCQAGRSVSLGASLDISYSCEATRRTAARGPGVYYAADVSRPQRMVAEASVGLCLAPTTTCRFEAAVTLLVAS
jgi:hypothetical protein